MLWLVIALPALTVPAGLATWYLAARGNGSEAVGDEVQRIGQMQLADVRPDAQAARLAVHALATVQADRTRVEITLSGDAGDGALTLELRHPADAARDQSVVLEALGDGHYVAHLQPLGPNAWNARLTSASGWRLGGRLEAGQSRFELVPAVGAG
jgi:hypothetical protein